ncbi:CBP80/20-dependent translation initiation factor-like [Branchiostoma floridae]|uniref:CBP80/20-dependent translation initiation factor-like n=1 Tax=Branchiostoma floridae TaxID=7739 RepID=A0A9J7MZW9_BRAFL|nr:CBP80/20-dependent translation initiation factor-like [Branchiostoma floridae]
MSSRRQLEQTADPPRLPKHAQKKEDNSSKVEDKDMAAILVSMDTVTLEDAEAGSLSWQLTDVVMQMEQFASTGAKLKELVRTTYNKSLQDQNFARVGARLCGEMATHEVDGVKLRSEVLTRLQEDYKKKESLHTSDQAVFLGFVTLLCELFGVLHINGEPMKALVGPVYDTLMELLSTKCVSDDEVLCCTMQLEHIGQTLEQSDPSRMSALMGKVRDCALGKETSPFARCLIMEVVERHANNWEPLPQDVSDYYSSTLEKLLSEK